ncbi:uncharacterized protein LOC144103613 [Amblyomma americanum]
MLSRTYVPDDGIFEEYRRFLRHPAGVLHGDVYRPPVSPRLRNLADRLNPLELYNDHEFSARYRFSKETVLALLAALQTWDKADNRGASLQPALKLLIALRFYGTGAMQTVVGDLVNVSQPAVCRSIWESLFAKYVNVPSPTEARAVL